MRRKMKRNCIEELVLIDLFHSYFVFSSVGLILFLTYASSRTLQYVHSISYDFTFRFSGSSVGSFHSNQLSFSYLENIKETK